MSDSDVLVETLIARAREDRSALGRLLERYRPYLLNITRPRLGGRLAVRSDASDIVQQTLMDIHQAFPKFQGASEPELSAWINRIHHHNLAEAIRKHVHVAKQSIDKEQPIGNADGSASFWWREPAAKQSTPSQRLIQGEKALRLAEILESLPEMQREAVRLRHLEGWHVEKIAKELDRSLAATAGLIKRGLQALRAQMAEQSSKSL